MLGLTLLPNICILQEELHQNDFTFSKNFFFGRGSAALGMDPRASCALGKHPTSELCPGSQGFNFCGCNLLEGNGKQEASLYVREITEWGAGKERKQEQDSQPCW